MLNQNGNDPGVSLVGIDVRAFGFLSFGHYSPAPGSRTRTAGEMLKQTGRKVTLIHAGRHKIDGTPYEPLPDAVREEYGREMEGLRQLFAATVAAGWHGRRRAGPGEDFWQFRPFMSGESMRGIDWRRSARDETLYVREREHENAHTVWLWADPSPSMLYKSAGATVSKESRALVLALALAELLSRSGERIAWPGLAIPGRTPRCGGQCRGRILVAVLCGGRGWRHPGGC